MISIINANKSIEPGIEKGGYYNPNAPPKHTSPTVTRYPPYVIEDCGHTASRPKFFYVILIHNKAAEVISTGKMYITDIHTNPFSGYVFIML